MIVSIYAIPGLKFKDPLPMERWQPKDASEMVDKIKNCVSSYYGIPMDRIHSKRRDREIVIARQMMHRLIKDNTRLSLKEIGRTIHIGKPLDHTTIIHSLRTISNLVDTDAVIRQQYAQIQTLVYT